ALLGGALAAAAAVGMLGCAPAPAPSETAAGSSASPSASVEVIQRRTDYAAGILVIAVTNTGDDALVVTRAELDDARFAEPAVVSGKRSIIPAGRTVDLRTPIPAADCENEADVAEGAVPAVRLETEDGATLDVAPTDPTGTVDRLVGAACLASDVAGIVAITPPEALRVTGDGVDAVAHLDLALDPTGADSEVRISGVHSTNLIASPDTGTSWVLDRTVSGTDEPGVLALDVRPTRCDAHAVAEDKVGTILVLDVAVDGGGPGTIQVPMPDPVRVAIYDYLAQVCRY
ncbi:hypothetical protein, partial [Agromyces seonyuensis]